MKGFFSKKGVHKFLFRWMVVNVVYFAVKMTMEHDGKEYEGLFTSTSLFYYVSAFFLLMLTWEVNDYLLKRHKKYCRLNLKRSLKIICINMSIMLPMCALVYYLAQFTFKEAWGIVCPNGPEQQFIIDFSRGVLIGMAVIFANMFHYAMNHHDELEKQLEDLQKDMLASQYASLKNQISPHFLFNSLNTLTSLMYEDRDLASDFVTRLARSYRYILDNREHDLVTLSKELGFLDAFTFMMDVRHKEAVTIDLNISVDPERYLIPTLSLQMLVENALKHNLYSKEKPLKVSISTISKDALVIKNNFQKRNLKEKTTELGIKNIKKRYAFYTNKQVLVRKESDFFEVIIPLLSENITKMNLKAIS
ncbi:MULTISPECIES: sensor histidine kinase [Croceitalea]|uniref:Histidine kinase n=1 Tax=Croceitalea vernalis TaxID=3075599 RepID=A0ABU3BCI7_9FLAO|nr:MULTISPECIES: histidine kinase [unclassified Croceitalea]MDT0538398.1 histidine kinase [Croceitalea sp. P059]MDT0620181.1 histidine kinase [Croceitalea sp. P007]